MKHLLLMRHAKSSWADEGMDDHDRPLNDRGRRDAPRMAAHLAEIGRVPDLIVASTAQRVVETLEGMASTLGPVAERIVFRRDLYLATPGTILRIGAEHAVADDVGTLLIVGHNPGMEQTVAHFRDVVDPMPTAAIGICRLDITDWDELASAEPSVAESMLVRPKGLG